MNNEHSPQGGCIVQPPFALRIVFQCSSNIRDVWGYPHEGSTKKLQVNMANIRKKFGVKPGDSWYISNELGVGYRMNGEKDE